MGRHNIIRVLTSVVSFISKWFNLAVDIENNIIPDVKGVNNAIFTNLKSLKWTNTGLTEVLFRAPDLDIDLNESFSIIFRGIGSSGSSGDRFRWFTLYESGTSYIEISNVNSSSGELVINGTVVANVSQNLQSIEGVIILTKTTNDVSNNATYKVYLNGTEILSYTGAHVFPNIDLARILTYGQNNWNCELRDMAFTKSILNTTEISNLTGSYSIFNAIKSKAYSLYWSFAENSKDLFIDCIQGKISEPSDLSGSISQGLDIIEDSLNKFALNQKNGFDIYQDISLNKYYIPLNANSGLSFALDLSSYGLTYVTTVSQPYSYFLNDYTKFKLIEPISSLIIAADVSEDLQAGGVAKELSYEDIQNSSLSFVQEVNKITDLTI